MKKFPVFLLFCFIALLTSACPKPNVREAGSCAYEHLLNGVARKSLGPDSFGIKYVLSSENKNIVKISVETRTGTTNYYVHSKTDECFEILAAESTGSLTQIISGDPQLSRTIRIVNLSPREDEWRVMEIIPRFSEDALILQGRTRSMIDWGPCSYIFSTRCPVE